MERELTCIRCPLGCQITVEIESESKKILNVTGNTCPRGAEYAESECINPVRTVTSTVMTADGRPVPVKTDRAIPKDKIFECMAVINNAVAITPVKIGDVIVADVFGSNIVAAANAE